LEVVLWRIRLKIVLLLLLETVLRWKGLEVTLLRLGWSESLLLSKSILSETLSKAILSVLSEPLLLKGSAILIAEKLTIELRCLILASKGKVVASLEEVVIVLLAHLPDLFKLIRCPQVIKRRKEKLV